MIKSFPKIFAIGTDYIQDIFKNSVEITEKIDGSQFVFGKIKGELFLRSKGAQLFIDNPTKMFQEAIDYIISIEDKITNNTIYFCEYLKTPKHNVLGYERIPKNHLILFGVSDETGTSFKKKHTELIKITKSLDIDVVPLLYKGRIKKADELLDFMEKESFLGKVKTEGIVVKNYKQPFLLGGQPIPLMMGKYVSEKFKEVHRTTWKRDNTSKGKWELFIEGFCTEARWQKAVQHLREKGKLENEPKDIGKLMKEINLDIISEEKENIKEFLWKEFGNELLRKASKGMPEWYKKQLLKKTFE